MRHSLFVLAAVALAAASTPLSARTPEQVADAALRAAPVWDGHNDVPEQLRDRRKNVLAGFDFRDTSGTGDAAKPGTAMQTDILRLRKGRVGAQFWSVFVSARLSDTQAVQAVIEQIDVARRLVAANPGDMALCLSAADVEKAMREGRIASLIGMEGGHSIGNSLAVLRQTHALGARYMTLTHFLNNAWADSGTDAPAHDGLTDFGRDVVREMQRIGMLVDLSHTSEATMLDALEVARAPVMFSHSGAMGVSPHPRNVPDAVLDRLKANGGIVMINFYPAYVSPDLRTWNGERAAVEARGKALWPDRPVLAAQVLADWEKANPRSVATLQQVADHVDYIVRRIGIDHVGLGGDFDGGAVGLQGLPDVSAYPALFVELARRGYVQADLEKIASRNMLRVLKGAETYAAAHREDPPIENPTSF